MGRCYIEFNGLVTHSSNH